MTRRSKALAGLCLTLVMLCIGAAYAQATKTFTGKITEIARGSSLDVGQRDTFYILRLENYPNIEFRLSQEYAGRSGVIDAAGPTEVLTPKKSKGLGWKVKLTCNAEKTGSLKAPVYQVLSLERLND